MLHLSLERCLSAPYRANSTLLLASTSMRTVNFWAWRCWAYPIICRQFHPFRRMTWLGCGGFGFQKSKKGKFFFWYASVRKNSRRLAAASLILKLQRGYLRAEQLVSSYTWEFQCMDSSFTHRISCGIGCFKSGTLSMEPWRAEVHEQNQSSGSNDQTGWSISS